MKGAVNEHFLKSILLLILSVQAEVISPEELAEFEALGQSCTGHGDTFPIFFKPGKPEPGESLESSLHSIDSLENLFGNLGILRWFEFSDPYGPDPSPRYRITGYADHEECLGEEACTQLA